MYRHVNPPNKGNPGPPSGLRGSGRVAIAGIGAAMLFALAVPAAQAGSLQINVPNGHVYWSNGNYITTAFSLRSGGVANWLTMNCLDDNSGDAAKETFEVAITTDSGGSNVLASAQISNNFSNNGTCDAHRYSFDFPNVQLTANTTYYLRTKVLASAPVRAWAGATLYTDGSMPDYTSVQFGTTDVRYYWSDGSSTLDSFTPSTRIKALFVTLKCLDDDWDNDAGVETFEVAICSDWLGNTVLASAQVTNNFRTHETGDGHLYLFDFPDRTLSANTTYYIRAKALSGTPIRWWGAGRLYSSNLSPVRDGPEAELADAPDQPAVSRSGGADIRYTVPRAGRVRLEVFGVDGRAVALLVDQTQTAGSRSVHWDGRNSDGSAVPSGLYLYKLSTGGSAATHKIVIVR